MEIQKIHKRTANFIGLGPSMCGCIRIQKKGEAGGAFACERCQDAYTKEYWREYARQLSIS